jgi:hypothetical protein
MKKNKKVERVELESRINNEERETGDMIGWKWSR